jgi:hypothetical protein
MRDPHNVYEKVAYLFYESYGAETTIVKRSFFPSSIFPYWLNAVLVTLNDSVNIIKSVFRTKRLSLFREFSTASIIVCLPFAFAARKRLVYNINHNLNSRHQRFLIKLLSPYLRFSFLGGGQSVKDISGDIEIIPFKSKRAAIIEASPIARIAVFVGSRAEQLMPSLGAACADIRRFADKMGLGLVFVGQNVPADNLDLSVTFVNDLKSTVENSCAILLYNPHFYNVRHSGILWEIIEYAPAIVSVSSDTIKSTLSAYPGPSKLINVDNGIYEMGCLEIVLAELILNR